MEQDDKSTRAGAGISRRDFSRIAAMVAATAAIPNRSLAGTAPGAASVSEQTPATPAQTAEADAQVQIILAKYGDRLSDEQKADIKRLVAAAVKTSEEMHAFHLDNSDEPAMIYRARLAEGEARHAK
jgi:hypothetical protein